MEKKFYIKEDGVRFRKTPDTSNTENIIRQFLKGEEIIITEEPWVKIKLGNEEGWVRTDYIIETNQNFITTTQSIVDFTIGKTNLANNPSVIKLREIIGDEFGLGKLGTYLNCTEYALYMVKTRLGINIEWPAKIKSGRNGGVWWKIFQDAGKYKITTEPKENCVICLTDNISSKQEDNLIGHIAFVEKVFPDGSIKISEANWPPPGTYNERTLEKEKWKNKYKAQFIDFIQ